VKEELYGAADNPTPAMDLIHRIYTLTAAGNVKVWAKDETELSSMKNALKVGIILRLGHGSLITVEQD
jgi:hypothetical protein